MDFFKEGFALAGPPERRHVSYRLVDRDRASYGAWHGKDEAMPARLWREWQTAESVACSMVASFASLDLRGVEHATRLRR